MRMVLAVLVFAAVSGAGLASEIPNRYDQVTVGEWVIYSDTSGDSDGEQAKFTVIDIQDDGKTIVVNNERFDIDGELIDSREISFDIDDMGAHIMSLEERAKQIGRERLVVKDQEVTVTAVSWDDEENDREFKIWISGDVPIGGMVKLWSSDPDVPAAELLDYGFADN